MSHLFKKKRKKKGSHMEWLCQTGTDTYRLHLSTGGKRHLLWWGVHPADTQEVNWKSGWSPLQCTAMESLLVQPHSTQRQPGMFTQSSSENKLRFICTFSARSHSQRRSSHEEDSANRHCESVLVTLPSQCSVYQLRLHICIVVGPGLDRPICDSI